MKKLLIPAISLYLLTATFACNKNSNDGPQPMIELLGPNPLNWALNEPYVDPGAVAYVVSESGDTTNLTSRLVMTDNVNVAKEGTYNVYYNVSDADGIAAEQKTRTVKVVLGK